MTPYTQSNVDPGNCWQTAIACILDVDPDSLPPQVEIESWRDGELLGWSMYSNALQGYLGKHHGLVYFEIQSWQFGGVRPARPDHIMCGPTVRTAALASAGKPHINHCVVGRDGAAVWDVHPSRAGLIEVERWGLLGAADAEFLRRRDERHMSDSESDQAFRLVFGCLCPSCGLDEARRRVQLKADTDAIAREC